ncbi:hypothetical protein GCM10017674_60790 [Streptomyces gardneri]|uniref:Uncharacterized protein n=1 Tax=Streptomyces gardneri TaxID=66892 RepID=A0A4Y3RIN9_9ACTN|nr:hypothetical protein SGA01_28440 [Streptomyces gardneri]GHH13479.1 hypothetical protein GCM10017674_60790 [Streptomyces gardneri]
MFVNGQGEGDGAAFLAGLNTTGLSRFINAATSTWCAGSRRWCAGSGPRTARLQHRFLEEPTLGSGFQDLTVSHRAKSVGLGTV